jgi:hypothetical protein
MNEAQKDQGTPWSSRVRVTPLRTYSGRVVYDRDRHFFSARDIERIAEKAQSDHKKPKDLSAWDRLLRALWLLYFPIILPYPADWDQPLFMLLGGIFVDVWENINDPIGAITNRYKNFIMAIAGLLNIETWLADTYKSWQTKEEEKKQPTPTTE